MRLFSSLVSVFALVSAVGAQAPKAAAPAVPCAHPLDGRTIVFVANGAGGGIGFAQNLREEAAEARSGLVIRTIDWSRYGNVPEDNGDQEGHFKAAARAAQCIQALRCQCPHSRFVVVGYSAGSRVALATAEMLPPGTLDRVVVLASSVSTRYDLRPALKTACGGIDSFYSRDDQVLMLAEDYLRTSDGQKGPMAGRVGFCDPCQGKDGAYANVRQYRWIEQMGGQGEHTFWARPLFMHRTLVPLLMTAGCPIAPLTHTKEPPLATR